MWLAAILVCQLESNEQCVPVASRILFETEAQCVHNVTTEGVEAVEAYKDYEVKDVKCFKFNYPKKPNI